MGVKRLTKKKLGRKMTRKVQRGGSSFAPNSGISQSLIDKLKYRFSSTFKKNTLKYGSNDANKLQELRSKINKAKENLATARKNKYNGSSTGTSTISEKRALSKAQYNYRAARAKFRPNKFKQSVA